MPYARTFLALPLHTHQRRSAERLVRLLRANPEDGVRWTPADKWHVTLVFLGDVPDSTLADVCDLTAEACRETPIFDWELDGIGTFPVKGNHRVLWMGVRDPSGEMGRLKSRIEARLQSLGFKPEARAFRPHVTMARVMKRGGISETLRTAFAAHQAWKGEPGSAEECQIMASGDPSEFGAYALLARCPLAARVGERD